ncbi:hypothetical protein CXG81DRAFT_21499 [Caulochytrium protostelioides]|uniref:Uncharacterized protein n=1 Tax=Caulochytrium protostelioides TaxID=1555241 RepID=A0A4P9X1Y4_9FUNG|nr:hypothetical protein CXG81DRAFT_21499 [Caulochytrium protostelioides]|eukprot:RKO98250.1 hypothetical protein CXG81DRAFT_21499 [Caulochytrium protostelioides]
MTSTATISGVSTTTDEATASIDWPTATVSDESLLSQTSAPPMEPTASGTPEGGSGSNTTKIAAGIAGGAAAAGAAAAAAFAFSKSAASNTAIKASITDGISAASEFNPLYEAPTHGGVHRNPLYSPLAKTQDCKPIGIDDPFVHMTVFGSSSHRCQS